MHVYMLVCLCSYTSACMFRTPIFNNSALLRVIYFLTEWPTVYLLGLYIQYSFGNNMLHFICVHHIKANQNFPFFDCLCIWELSI